MSDNIVTTKTRVINKPGLTANRKNALEALGKARRGGKALESYNEYITEIKNEKENNNNIEDDDDDMDDFIVDHNPKLDRLYREVTSDDEEEIEEKLDPKLKKLKRTDEKKKVALSNQKTLQFSTMISAPAKKSENLKTFTKAQIKEKLEVDVDDLWNTIDESAIVQQKSTNVASHLFMNNQDKLINEFLRKEQEMKIDIDLNIQKKMEEEPASKKRKREEIEDKSSPSGFKTNSKQPNNQKNQVEPMMEELPLGQTKKLEFGENGFSNVAPENIPQNIIIEPTLDDLDNISFGGNYQPKEESIDEMMVEQILQSQKKEAIKSSLLVHKAEELKAVKEEEEELIDNKLWENLENNLETKLEIDEISTQQTGTKAQELPLEADGSLNFYLIDVYEDQYTYRGKIFLFGKVKCKLESSKYESCCIIVPDIKRVVYVVPKEYKRDGKQVFDDTKDNKNQERVDFKALIEDFQKEAYNSMQVFNKNEQDPAKKSDMNNLEFRYGIVDRKYAFELPIVNGSRKYLKVAYSAKLPELPAKLKGQTFSHIIGTSWSPLENFLIKKNIMGPQWLKIKSPEIIPKNTKDSWCLFECKGLWKNISTCPEIKINPPLKVMSLALKIFKNKKNNKIEICNISATVYDKIDVDASVDIDKIKFTMFSVVKDLGFMPLPKGFEKFVQNNKKLNIKIENSEHGLLSYFIGRLAQYDPDIITGHDAYSSILENILQRSKDLKVPNVSRLGRLKQRYQGNGSSIFKVRAITCGRLICDTYLSSREYIKDTDYTLTKLAKSQLKAQRNEVDFLTIPEFYKTNELLAELVKHTEKDAYLTLALMSKLQIIQLTKQLTCIAGNLWARSLQNARAERNEMLLMHEFHKYKFIYPDKFTKKNDDKGLYEIEGENEEKNNNKKDKKKYLGGLVLEPKSGLYEDYILLLDFQSLYPSIIQEYNICFTSIERDPVLNSMEKNEKSKGESEPSEIIDTDLSTDDMIRVYENKNDEKKLRCSVLPKVIKKLVDQRREVKKDLKNAVKENEKQSLDIKQRAIKLIANSMYGCLGFSSSRFYAKPLAATITKIGRNTLQNTVNFVQNNKNKEVIYGDTDSIMINTKEKNLLEALELGSQIKSEINKLYKNLQIEIDGIFRPLLLLKKKKYAAKKLFNLNDFLSGKNHLNTTPEFHQEVKGLDLVRREWCPLSKVIGHTILNYLLSDVTLDEKFNLIRDYLTDIGNKIKNDQIAWAQFIITKQLSKHPNLYPDAKSQPHVQVALRLIANGSSEANLIKHIIPYIIVQNNKESLAEKALHPDEYLKSKKEQLIDIDREYYLHNQIMPPISRIISVLVGISVQEIANALGIDGQKYRNLSINNNNQGIEYEEEDQKLSFDMKLPQIKIKTRCKRCSYEHEFIGGTIKNLENTNGPCYDIRTLKCMQANCDGYLDEELLKNRIAIFLKDLIKSYYQYSYECTFENETEKKKITQQHISLASDNNISIRSFCYFCRFKYNDSYNEKIILNKIRALKKKFIFGRISGKDLLEPTDPSPIYKKMELYQKPFFKNKQNYLTNFLSKSTFEKINLAKIFEKLNLNTKMNNN